jgi:hypothetical protein
MAQAQSVTLSDGTIVVVGPLRWAGYKSIRNILVAEALPGLAKAIQGVLRSQVATKALSALPDWLQAILKPHEADPDEAERESAPPQLSIEDLQALPAELSRIIDEVLPDLCWNVGNWSDELTAALVEHTTAPTQQVDRLSFQDVAALRAAAAQANDLASLVELEKNWLAALATSGRRLLGLGQSSPPAGGSDGSPFSSESTDGAQPPSMA